MVPDLLVTVGDYLNIPCKFFGSKILFSIQAGLTIIGSALLPSADNALRFPDF